MSNSCTFINKPVDLGCLRLILKDQIQLSISGWVEPRETEEDPAVPFDFKENEDEKYMVSFYITLHEFSKPIVVFSSDDDKGVDGFPSVILTTGTHPDEDPSNITLDASCKDIKEFKYLRDFLLGIIMTNPEGTEFTIATAKIKNDLKNYS